MSDAEDNTIAALGRGHETVADAAVEVVVSFPPLLMSVAEVEGLRRNSVIGLGKRLVEVELSVLAGGRRLGSGYLVVRIEDQAGVLLSRVEPPGR